MEHEGDGEPIVTDPLGTVHQRLGNGARRSARILGRVLET